MDNPTRGVYPFDPALHARALAILAEPLRAAGMGEPPMLDTNNPGSLLSPAMSMGPG